MTAKTKPFGTFDDAYSDRIMAACLEAIVTASIDPATKTAPLRSGEIYRALMKIMATFIATSQEASSPTKVRRLAEEFAKDLRRQIGISREHFDLHGLPFDVLDTAKVN